MRPLVKETPDKSTNDFEEMISPLLHVLRTHCCYVARSTWDGEDLMQDVLIRLYKRWHQNHMPVSKSYALRAATNAWVDRLRKRKPEEQLTDQIHEQEKTHHSSEALDEAVSRLLACTAKQRLVFLLVEAFDFSINETASLLGETEGSIKASLHRARKRVNKKEENSTDELDEKIVSVYSNALQEGDIGSLITLYHQEVKAVMKNQYVGQIQGISTSGYLLLSFTLKTGRTLYVPIYQKELGIVLAYVHNLTKLEVVAA